MSVLHEMFREVTGSFSPIPPPLRLKEEEKAQTFGIDLSKMEVVAPGYWRELKHVKELLGHEVKHGSADGLPYTYRNALRFEAYVMKWLDVPLETAKMILNVVYDVIVDLKVKKEGLDVRGMNIEWLRRFPVKKENEGTSYHLLQILYKDFFGIPLKKTRYEHEVRSNPLYPKLKRLLEEISEECESLSEERDVQKIVEAAEIVARLSRPSKPPEGRASDVQFDRGDPNVRADAAEIGIDAELSNEQLAQLMGLGEDESLSEELEKAAEDKVREALWGEILGFKDLFTASSFYELKEPVLERWKPYSRTLDPTSVMKNPSDPRKWKALKKQNILTVEQEGDAGGFSEIIMLLDQSGSTATLYKNRSVLSYIKDAAYGLLAYAKRFRLPVATISFHSYARILSGRSRNYVGHGKRIFMLRSTGFTNLGDAVERLRILRPEKALVALITDGLVSEDHLLYLADQRGVNRVVAAVVESSKEGVENVKRIGDKVQLYTVKPDSAGRTIVSSLPQIILLWGNSLGWSSGCKKSHVEADD